MNLGEMWSCVKMSLGEMWSCVKMSLGEMWSCVKMSLGEMYGRTTVRPIVDPRNDDKRNVDPRGRRLPIRTIGRTVVRPYMGSSEP